MLIFQLTWSHRLVVRTQAFQAWNRSSILREITSVKQNTSSYHLMCFVLENKPLYFRTYVMTTAMFLKIEFKYFSKRARWRLVNRVGRRRESTYEQLVRSTISTVSPQDNLARL